MSHVAVGVGGDAEMSKNTAGADCLAMSAVVGVVLAEMRNGQCLSGSRGLV